MANGKKDDMLTRLPLLRTLLVLGALMPRGFSASPSASEFNPTIPDVLVYDQQGRGLRFQSELVNGRTVVINFIFTSCTTTCPPLTAAMRRIQQELADRVGRDIWLISLTVDPLVDKPERLRTFAAEFSAGPGWSFITGSKPDIDRLLKAFGSYSGDAGAHSTTMVIGNERAGRWVRTNGLASLATNVKLILETAKGPEAKPGAVNWLEVSQATHVQLIPARTDAMIFGLEDSRARAHHHAGPGVGQRWDALATWMTSRRSIVWRQSR